MAGEPLWQSAKEIVVEMRGLLQSDSTKRAKESQVGWQYILLEQCKAMKADMESRGYHVRTTVKAS
jgi:hypothetical protein